MKVTTYITGAVVLALSACMALAETDRGTHEHKGMPADKPAAAKAIQQKSCPFMTDEPIDKKIYADHDGKRVYFCCKKCQAKFKKDPAKYIKKIQDQGIALEKAPKPQKVCPLMGGKIDKKVFADHKGKRVYFCCPACNAKFKKSPDKYWKVELFKEKGFERRSCTSCGKLSLLRTIAIGGISQTMGENTTRIPASR